jgi:hypothetical protein
VRDAALLQALLLTSIGAIRQPLLIDKVNVKRPPRGAELRAGSHRAARERISTSLSTTRLVVESPGTRERVARLRRIIHHRFDSIRKTHGVEVEDSCMLGIGKHAHNVPHRRRHNAKAGGHCLQTGVDAHPVHRRPWVVEVLEYVVAGSCRKSCRCKSGLRGPSPGRPRRSAGDARKRLINLDSRQMRRA